MSGSWRATRGGIAVWAAAMTGPNVAHASDNWRTTTDYMPCSPEIGEMSLPSVKVTTEQLTSRSVTAWLDQTYADADESQNLDVFAPVTASGKSSRPISAFIHGGG